ncbi:bifunctional salicylyl-CoA 5-hydroxylase/oxidoreductase [Pendulispora brunnea]|uniref:Bifunctional salicylyl-CoA 5-hydroxylase/oxidoreductase n=1 Tax=Pendulispora brunnea TaxID=2905690 RepID=A0ABZ2JZT5_9BACT
MKIACIGGGPAGLYFGILMKKANPSSEVVVLERNAPGETFGWGVVFSDETLEYLEQGDRETHEEITRVFAHWDAIDIHYRGSCIRSGGHGFSGLARRKLLDILARRATELGVEIRFRTEVDDFESLDVFRDADLVVAADGVNSKVRARYADVFRPHLDVRQSKYIWLGTTKTFDAFQFIFEENEDGLFQVHGYRFDDATSTFIVECDQASWRKAGLDRATTDESIAYLERLFARHLDGHRLLTNRSMWVNFVTVKNSTWRHGKVVLMGDAAHTAHFSIGSGTKMAMEDAIALAAALEKTGVVHEDRPTRKRIEEALEAYENDRYTMVLRIQKAAQDSYHWFEGSKRYLGHEPLSFAMSLLSRSKRIGYDNLKVRDPALVTRATEDFVARCRIVDRDPADPPPPPMFTPFTLRGLTLQNRVVVSSMCMYSAKDGLVDDFHLVHLGSRAMGGAGLVMTEMTDVSRDGRITPGCAGMYLPEHVTAWRRIVDFVHQRSRAAIGMQIAHAGRKGSTKLLWEGMDEPLDEGNWPIIGPSPIPYTPRSQVPKEMDRADMDRVKADFVRATLMAQDAGFDLLEVHLAHGYLLSSFLSPLSNVRKDGYGGSLENRMRYPLEVVEAVRAVWPKDKPLSVRISATDWHDQGFTGDDAVVLGGALKERGTDIVDVSTGQTSIYAQPVYGRMYQTPYSDRVRNEAKVPTMTVGAITTADQVNTILIAGRADLCVLARPHLRNPNWTFAAAEEQGYMELGWPDQYESVRPRPKL